MGNSFNTTRNRRSHDQNNASGTDDFVYVGRKYGEETSEPLQYSKPGRRTMRAGKGERNCDVEIFLIGMAAGHGKRSTGNTILGRYEFKVSESRETRSGWTETNELTIKVVNFPVFPVQETKLGSLEHLKQTEVNLSKGFYPVHCPQGFHALVLVMKYGTFTDQEKEAVTLLKGMLGDDIIRKHCILAFTHGETFLKDNPNVKFEDWCKKQRGDLRQLIDECCSRVVLFHNMTSSKADDSNSQLISFALGYHGRYTKEIFEKHAQKRSAFILKKSAKNNNNNGGGSGAKKSAGKDVGKEHWIDYERIKLNKALGSGGFGAVYEGTLDGKKKVAIKEFRLADQKTIEREVIQLFSLKHPNIVDIYGAARHSRHLSMDPDVYLVMELADSGSLYDALDSSKNKPSFREAISWGFQCAEGVAYLHSQSVVHRDLKPHNCLLFRSKTVLKICDFGLARKITGSEQSMTQVIGTPLYIAPEVLADKHYTEKCDVYSWAIMMREILTCEEPFGRQDPVQAKIRGGTPLPIKDVPDDLNKFMSICWSRDPSERPTMDQVVQNMKAFKQRRR